MVWTTANIVTVISIIGWVVALYLDPAAAGSETPAERGQGGEAQTTGEGKTQS